MKLTRDQEDKLCEMLNDLTDFPQTDGIRRIREELVQEAARSMGMPVKNDPQEDEVLKKTEEFRTGENPNLIYSHYLHRNIDVTGWPHGLSVPAAVKLMNYIWGIPKMSARYLVLENNLYANEPDGQKTVETVADATALVEAMRARGNRSV